VIDLHLAERKKADDIQERVSTICYEQIIPALSEICDILTENQEQLLLNRLELDVGVIQENELEKELVDKLISKFEEQIRELILTSIIDDRAASSSGNKEQNKNMTSRTRVELLMYFFRRGTVPWWSPYLKTDLREWIKEQFSEDAQSLISALKQELGSHAVRGRVIQYFSDAQFRRFFEIQKLTDVFEFYGSVKQMIQSEYKQGLVKWNKMRTVFLDLLLSRLGKAGSVASKSPFSGSQSLSAVQKQRMVAGVVYLLVEEHGVPRNIFDELISVKKPGTQIFSAGEWERVYDEVEARMKSEVAKEEQESDQESEIKFGTSVPEDQFIEIENAGLVLLWPYLDTLFEHLGFVEDGAFVSNSATHRAVHLLHFISTGHEEGEEHEWPLNKLLCSLEPEAFVPGDIELSDHETEEAEAIIKTAIEHWKALKNTSVSGFRETFLLRHGIIVSDPHGWKVEIERITYDILLDKLPWPISIIKLPWNEEIIHVQW
jgi:hypothetical protein